jgi:hypothetical protein
MAAIDEVEEAMRLVDMAVDRIFAPAEAMIQAAPVAKRVYLQKKLDEKIQKVKDSARTARGAVLR